MRHYQRAIELAKMPPARPSEPHQFSGPLYEQVRSLILSRIESGDWRVGTPIPPEVQLSRDFGVSIGTVRKALDQLARDRILVRERGRGTFVKDGGARRTGFGFSFSDADGVPVQAAITLASAEYAVATREEIAALRMMQPALIVARALKMRREWRQQGKLFCIETITVDATRFPNLQFEVDASAETFFQVYADQYHYAVDRTAWTIKPLLKSDPVAVRLSQGRDVTLMKCVRTAFDAKELPLELCEQTVIFDGSLMLSAGQ
jgi:GntR family transcriptional regulator